MDAIRGSRFHILSSDYFSRFSRDDGVKAGEKEVMVDASWSIAVKADDPARARLMAGHLADFLTRRMNVALVVREREKESAVQKKTIAREGGILLSAATGEGVGVLLRRLQAILQRSQRYAEITVPFTRMSLLQRIYRIAEIIEETHAGDGVRIKMIIDAQNYGRLRKALAGAEQ